MYVNAGEKHKIRNRVEACTGTESQHVACCTKDDPWVHLLLCVLFQTSNRFDDVCIEALHDVQFLHQCSKDPLNFLNLAVSQEQSRSQK